MQDIVYPLADFLQWTFGILEFADNWPNYLFITLGFVGLAIWMKMQRDYDKEAAKNGTLR